MKDNIAYCGLDCEKCQAYIATKNNDDELREKTAELWSRLNNVEITKEMINCEGCRGKGVKTPYCQNLCEIRKCALKNHYDNCGKCADAKTCEKIAPIISTNNVARKNLGLNGN